jgi:predicted hotdog family 3-hydroxylacyl-ACP dehydratase
VRLDRDWIESHIPHKGRMCLLDEVLQWDPIGIRCRSSTHRAPDNPLRTHGRLGVACGIEYAAQAMAVHGALLAPQGDAPAQVGYLGSLRSIKLHVASLDQIDADLIAAAERLSADPRLALYGFTVQAGEKLLLSGRATVILDARALRIAGEQPVP